MKRHFANKTQTVCVRLCDSSCLALFFFRWGGDREAARLQIDCIFILFSSHRQDASNNLIEIISQTNLVVSSFANKISRLCGCSHWLVYGAVKMSGRMCVFVCIIAWRLLMLTNFCNIHQTPWNGFVFKEAAQWAQRHTILRSSINLCSISKHLYN